MIILDKIYSEHDNVIKYIMQTDDKLILEFSYITKGDSKDIICVPCQTSCNMSCKFCHITDVCDKLVFRNLTGHEIYEGICIVYNDLELSKSTNRLLVSYMGLGEPLNNIDSILDSMEALNNGKIRFGLATSLPKKSMSRFYALMRNVEAYKFNVKVHLSLHYTKDDMRTEWMPNSTDIKTSISALELYHNYTGNPVEVHYALIGGLNDSESDALRLIDLLRCRDIPIKFLFFNEKETLDYTHSNMKRYQLLKCYLDLYGIKNEYYTPPGLDIGASCGQFLLDYYLKYNVKD